MKVTKSHAAMAALALLAGAMGVVVTASPVSAALSGATSTTTTSVTAGTTAALDGLGITAGDADQVAITLSTTRGTLSVDTGTGITLAYGYASSGAEIAFSGTGAQVNAALDAVTLSTSSGDKGQSATVSILARPSGDVVFSAANEHFYEYISDPGVTWSSARDGATTHWFAGQQGYLATVPNAAVNDLIATRIDGASNVWLGGAAANEGSQRVWRWQAGPLAGDEFSTCSSTAYNFNCDFVGTSGAYQSWAPSEPNNWDDGYSMVGESYIVTNWSGDIGRWNDLPNSAGGISGYVVEYGDLPIGSTVPFAGVVNASSTVAITGTPDAPGSVTAVSGLGTLSVTFSAPTNTGGSAIDGYRVVRTPGSVTTACDESPCPITGLTPGQAYTFTVQAHNAYGWSSSSASSTSQVGTVPSNPAALPSSMLLGQAFSASAATAGYPAASYSVTAGSLPSGVTLNGSTGQVSGTPTAAGAWGFTITATNTHGTASASYTGTTGSVPTLVTTSLGSFVWHAAVDTTLVATGSPAGVWSVTSGSLPAGLTLESDGRLHGTPSTVGTFSATLTVTNVHGTDQHTYSATVQGATPTAPTPTRAIPGDTTLTIEFTAPVNDGGQIEDYQYSLDGGTSWVSRSDGEEGSPLVISGLTNGTSYTVLLRATNSGGPGTASSGIAGTAAAAPDAPVLTSVDHGNGSADVYFTVPASDGGSDVLWYEYTLDAGVTWVRPDGVLHTSPLTVYGLENGVQYSVKLRAVSAAGPGAASDALTLSPEVAPVPTTEGGGYPELSPGAGGATANGEPVDVDTSAGRTTWTAQGPDFSVTFGAYDGATRPVRVDPQAASFVAYVGGYLLASGEGFAPGTTVDLWLFSTPALLGTATVKADGTFSAMVPLPAGVAAGNHTLQVNGLSTSLSTVSATMGIKVARTVPSRLASTGADLPIGAAVALLVLGIPMVIVARRRTREDA